MYTATFLIIVNIYSTVYATVFFNYTTCFDPNGSSSGVFSYTSFTIELQREIHTYLLTYIGQKRLRSSSFTPYLISSLVGGELLASRPGLFTPGERVPSTYWIGG
jgi:hypothetical protein